MRRGHKGLLLTGWAVPRYKPIIECKVMDYARVKLLYLIDLLERLDYSTNEIDETVLVFREESIAGLNYHTLLLEKELGIEREEPTQRVKRVRKVKKEKRLQRGGLFG